MIVSIIMPIFNGKDFLEDSISSILNQSFDDFELLLLDDGSEDSPIDVINQFQDSRIKYIRDEINNGIVFQLNKGISLAKGKYIARMDADDIAHPERLKRQVNFLENSKNKLIDVLGTNAEEMGDSNGNIDHKNYNPVQISFLLNFFCPLLHPSVMIRSSVFGNGLRYSTQYQFAEDYALWKIINNGKNIAILPETLLKYRIHNNQTNKNIQRLEIQYKSTLKVAQLNTINLFDKLFISKSTKEVFIKLWFGFSNSHKIYIIQRIYLKYRKKQLGIKLELLNNLLIQ